MAESKHAEHTRLQERTEALKKEHADLGVDRTPFNQADHDLHNAHLKKHRSDLAGHRARPADK
jgi:hypothetical protein